VAQDKVYTVINDRIMALLDKGVVPWRRPWRTAAGSSTDPINSQGRAYRGLNRLVLGAVAMLEGYQSNVWMTYKQAGTLGGKVKAGEKGTAVIFWKQLQVEDKDHEGKSKTIPMLRYYTVFNLDQTEGVKLPKKVAESVAQPKTHTVDTFEDGQQYVAEAEAIVLSMPNKPEVIEKQSNRAFYVPSLDKVTVPLRSQFEQVEEFYSTLFHELVHSTGHESRLNRKGADEVSHQFGDAPYAREELVAEMGNAFLSAEAGIDPATLENSAAYIASWKRALQDDPQCLVKAASAGQKAADFILNRQPEKGN
jgi:antirestriction protein ArdC